MILNKYLPFENYSIISSLSIEEIKRRLADKIEPKKRLKPSVSTRNSNKPYTGYILGDKFKISRIIDYRNSFLPVVTGKITTSLGKTQITVKMRPSFFTLIFITFWLGIVGLVCLGIIVVGIIQFKKVLRYGFSPTSLIPFALFLFGYLLTTLSFKAESRNSKIFLEQLFEGQKNT